MTTTADRAAVSDTIIAQLRSSLRELRCMGGDRMRRADVNPTAFHIVSLLERHGEMPMSRLAEVLDVSLSNASGVVDRMEERALIERVRVSDDRRVVLVRATDAGRALLTEMEVLKDDMLRRILARLTDAQLARLGHAFEDVRAAALDAFADDPEMLRHDLFRDHTQDHHRDSADAPSHAESSAIGSSLPANPAAATTPLG